MAYETFAMNTMSVRKVKMRDVARAVYMLYV